MSRSAIAVIRITGPNSIDVVQKMARVKKENIVPRKAVLRRIIDPANGEVLDNSVVLWFPQPNSFTGEDSVELHVHGGIAVISSVINALQRMPGFRMAEAGTDSCDLSCTRTRFITTVSSFRRVYQKGLSSRKT